MFEIKPISLEGEASAFQKAERYRLLNEPVEAESICLDLLRVDPENQEAIALLILVLTDQFQFRLAEAYQEARALLDRLVDAYARAYYEGVIYERRGKTHFRNRSMGSGQVAYEWLRKAMACYERAEGIRPPGNDDSILRWNTCARYIMRHGEIEAEEPQHEQMLE